MAEHQPPGLSELLRKKQQLDALVKRATGGDRANQAAAHSAQVAARSRQRYAEQAEVGPPGEPKNKRRQVAAGKSLLTFLTTYFPHSTGLKPFGDDHKRMIAEDERCIRTGGRLVNAIYRGAAKTTISENAALWAVLYGHRLFVLVVGINKEASTANIRSIKAELSANDLLAEDFPEVCKYIQALDNKPQAAPHQTCQGEHTHIVWRADTIVLPTIKGSAASGAIITAKPYAKARGVKFKRQDGVQARPDLVIVDDPQDDGSAATQLQVNKNLMILRKGIMQTSSRQAGLAAIVNATIIARHDMVETLLADPAWQGERVPMVKKWADEHETFWLKEYAAIRRTYDKSISGDQQRAHREATSFYRKHRREMDLGCLVSWKHCYKRGELSAIQHAYNILIDDGAEVFASEYQQKPMEEGEKSLLRLTADQIAGKLNGLARGVVPKLCQYVSAYVDVHRLIHYWVVSAWEPDFGGGPIDYGTWPKQPVAYFAQADPPIGLDKTYPGTEDSWVLAGLTDVVNGLLGHEFLREDGVTLKISKILIDARYKAELVRQFCRRHPQTALLHPAMGQYIGPQHKAFSEYRPEPGALQGLRWRIPSSRLHVSIDTNWWKTFTAGRLGMPVGAAGGWELFGRDPNEHRLFADHCIAEEPVELEAKGQRGGPGRTAIIWTWKPGRPDNHWFDALVGSAVAGSMLGAAPAGLEPTKQRSRPAERMSLAQLAGR